MSPRWAQVDGTAQNYLPATDRGFAYGDGVFETIRLQKGAAPLWPWHRARLSASCARLAIPFPAESIDQALQAALVASESVAARLKLMVTRGVGGRGWQPPVSAQPVVVALLWDELPVVQPLTLTVLSHRLPHNPALAGLKSLSGLDYVVAGAELSAAEPACDGLLLSATGMVVETLRHNLFAMIDGSLHTPDLGACGVAGVARQWLLDRSDPMVQIRSLSLAELHGASEVFVTNALIGAAPVLAVGETAWAAAGPVTRAVMANFAALFSGEPKDLDP